MPISNIHRPKSLVYIGCLHPIKASDGASISYYPCGKCPACLMAKATQRTQLINNELLTNGQYPLFCLLTYSDNHLPLVEVHYKLCADGNYIVTTFDINTGEQLSIDILTKSQLKKTIVYATKKQIKGYVRPTNKTCGKFITSVLRYKDVQDYLKRLRRFLEKKGLPSFRYAMCGEYGPTTQRPHYHIILFCTSALQRTLVSQFILQGWKYGLSNCQHFSGSNGGYISSYISSVNDVDTLYWHARLFRPQLRHSVHLGRQVFTNLFGDANQIFRDTKRFFHPREQLVNGHVMDVPAPCHYLTTLFTKCLRFNSVPHRTRVRYFGFAFECLTKCCNTPTDCANRLLDDFLFCCKVKSFTPDLHSLLFKDLILYDFPHDIIFDTPEVRHQIFDRLYRVCRVSFQAYTNIKNIFGSHVNPYNYLEKYVYFIEQLYADLDYYRLTCQLFKLQTATTDYCYDDIAYFIYDNYDGDFAVRDGEDKYNLSNAKQSRLYNDYCNYINKRALDSSKSKKVKDLITSKCNFYGSKCNVTR